MDFQIGFGALPNHHCILKSLSYKYPTPPYDDTMVDRFQDPGAGAFTYVSVQYIHVVDPFEQREPLLTLRWRDDASY